MVLRRRRRGHVRITNHDRWFFVQLYRWFPSILSVLTIIRSETLVRWHRAGFRNYWPWKSRSSGGRPQIDAELRVVIRRMSMDNPRHGKHRGLQLHREQFGGLTIGTVACVSAFFSATTTLPVLTADTLAVNLFWRRTATTLSWFPSSRCE
jgi:hypothetical protein